VTRPHASARPRIESPALHKDHQIRSLTREPDRTHLDGVAATQLRSAPKLVAGRRFDHACPSELLSLLSAALHAAHPGTSRALIA
jgi:hypothetical protein